MGRVRSIVLQVGTTPADHPNHHSRNPRANERHGRSQRLGGTGLRGPRLPHSILRRSPYQRRNRPNLTQIGLANGPTVHDLDVLNRPEPVVSENSNQASNHEFVLVDQAAQPVVATYPSWMVPEMPGPTVSSGHHLS